MRGWLLSLLTLLAVVLLPAAGCGNPTPLPTVGTLSKAYLSAEGHGNRGPRFAELVLRMDQQVVAGPVPTSRAALTKLLGPADYTRTAGQRQYDVYLHDRFAKRDWFVAVEYDARGVLVGYGYNAASELNLADWTRVEAAEQQGAMLTRASG